MEVSPVKPNRSSVDLSDDTLVRHWVKHLGKSREEIEAAVAKVGNNVATVRRELGLPAAEQS